MTDVSATLRAARERAGLTLEEISARTRIKVAFLQAIERGDFQYLPAPFFARAFLRTYAREIHLSPDEIIAAYESQFTPVVQAPAAAPPRDVLPAAGSLMRQSRPFPLPSPASLWPTAVLGIAAVTVVWLMARGSSSDATDTHAVGTSGVVTAPPAPAANPKPAAVPQKLTLDIRPSRVLWVAGMADGKRIIYRLVEPGEHVRVDANEELWFRVGDAGAFVYSVNGSPEKPLGNPGEVREFRITRDNLEPRSAVRSP